MREAAKNLASKNQVDNALDKANKNRAKTKNNQTFNLSYCNGRRVEGILV